MPNGRRDADIEYDPLWCKAEHARLNTQLRDIEGPDGRIAKVHKRIDSLWYLLAGVGIIGLANLIATLMNNGSVQ